MFLGAKELNIRKSVRIKIALCDVSVVGGIYPPRTSSRAHGQSDCRVTLILLLSASKSALFVRLVLGYVHVTSSSCVGL